MLEQILQSREVRAAVAQCHQARTIADIKEIISVGLRKLIPHDHSACGFGNFVSGRVHSYLNVDCPPEIFSHLFANNSTIYCPAFVLWRRSLAPEFVSIPQLQNSRAFQAREYQRWMGILSDFKMQNVAGHGLPDIAGRVTSFFALTRLEQPLTMRGRAILATVVPHLHVALTNVMRETRLSENGNDTSAVELCTLSPNETKPVLDKRVHGSLTRREGEILKWAFIGKTNAEIGMILNISEFTVKNHVQNILRKLGASNRTHAVAKAISQRLIQI